MSIIAYTTGNISIYRFYIATAPSSYCCEVFPLNFLATSLIDERETDQIFYRRKFQGSLLFGTNSTVIDEHGVEQNRKDDWTLFWNMEKSDPCEKIYLIITKETAGIIEVYWDGYFSTSDGKFDIDRCTFEVNPLTEDDYTDLLANIDLQYNILDVADVKLVNAQFSGTHADITFTRNRWLFSLVETSVLDFLADKIVPGVTVSSHFFTDATNPVTNDDNQLLYLTIAQKSDIIWPLATEHATTALMSWANLMDILWAMFQVKWDYNAVADTINVEHISWFTYSDGLNLSTQLSTKATNKYSYIKESMPKYEKFTFMEADEVNFVGVPIWYNSQCVDQDGDTNIKETKINITTDLEYIINNQDAIDNDGFVIFCNYLDGGILYVRNNFGELDPTFKSNMNLAWANLQNCYFRHERVLLDGNMNDDNITFWTAQKTKKQECSAILCADYDPSDKITTELGVVYFGGAKATVQRSELDPTGEIKFSLLYGPTDTPLPHDVPNMFGAWGDFSITHVGAPDDTMDIQFIFNDPCPGDYDIRIREKVYDGAGIHYQGAWVDVTFLTGTTSYDFWHTFEEGALAAGECIAIEVEYDDTEIEIILLGPPDPVWSCTPPPGGWSEPFIYTH